MAAVNLRRRKEVKLLVDALLQNRLRTAVGRIRATNVLNGFGRQEPTATKACVHCLDDRSSDVLSNALFGIVFMRRRDLIPELQKRLKALPSRNARRELFRDAIKALKADNPSLYSPGYTDAANVWRLSEP